MRLYSAHCPCRAESEARFNTSDQEFSQAIIHYLDLVITTATYQSMAMRRPAFTPGRPPPVWLLERGYSRDTESACSLDSEMTGPTMGKVLGSTG